MRKPNYDKFPVTKVYGKDNEAFAGYSEICSVINNRISELNKKKTIVGIECYHGINDIEVLSAFVDRLSPALVIESANANYSNDYVFNMIKRNLTDDRVRGVLSHHHIEEFFDLQKIAEFKEKIENVESGVIFVYGIGATLIAESDILIYADLARWELELRYRRKETANWCADNFGEDWLRMYKRGFFVDWPVVDRYKRRIFDKVDYLLDTNIKNTPKMVTKAALHEGLKKNSTSAI